MKRFLGSKKKVAAAAVAALAIAGGGSAFAYWTTNGSGTGEATTAASNGTLVLHASFGSGLTPGGSRPVTFTADNSNSSSLFVNTISSVVTTSDAACLPGDFTIAPVDSNTRVPANTSGYAVGAGTLSFNDSEVSQDACKSATITLTVSSN